MSTSQTAREHVAGTLAHVDTVRASVTGGNAQNGRSNGATGCNIAPARRMVAVTVALSEPAHLPELDWAGTIASNLRLLYGNSTVEIIDTWRVDNV